MSVPKKKLSKRRTRARRSHHGVATVHSIESPIPGDSSYIRPHHSHEYNGKVYTWQELKKLMSGLKKRAAAKATAKKEEAPAEEAATAESADKATEEAKA